MGGAYGIGEVGVALGELDAGDVVGMGMPLMPLVIGDGDGAAMDIPPMP